MVDSNIFNKNGKSYYISILLIFVCFALWGFTANVTGAMVQYFSKIFMIGVKDSLWVQVIYYLGYCLMAFPAAIFIRLHSFKAGILLGLAICAIGIFMFIPAKMSGFYYSFLFAYFIMTCGLSCLEVGCNTYVYTSGNPRSSITRINLAQAFNPLGALLGMYMAAKYVQERICPLDIDARAKLPTNQLLFIKNYDMGVLIRPYIFIGVVFIMMAILIRFFKVSNVYDDHRGNGFKEGIKQILKIKEYREGVIAQIFYIGAQVACWTFIIQYAIKVFTDEGMMESEAILAAQKYNIIAMILYCCSRFGCTLLLKFFKPEHMLMTFAILATLALCGVIFLTGRDGLYCLVMVSAFMSLMYPTIFGISLRQTGSNMKLAGAGHVMATVGGSLIPPIQAAIIVKCNNWISLPSTNLSFIIPTICFIIVGIYAFRSNKVTDITKNAS
jgi:FHS family L-fucose permease-like MFS transporter